jgi:hypothetical protein
VGGILGAGAASLGLGIGAIWVAYGARTYRNILLGTLCFGFAVFSVHFLAMAGTGFYPLDDAGANGPVIGNATLALIVTVIAFVICGSFLLSGVTLLPAVEERSASPAAALHTAPAVPLAGPAPQAPERQLEPAAKRVLQIPYELENRTLFVDSAEVAAIRAEGHYTILYALGQKLFCPWSISDAETRLPERQFIRAHRSYLVNPAHVTGFERKKDNGVVFFERGGQTEKVPVSRSRLHDVRLALGLI